MNEREMMWSLLEDTRRALRLAPGEDIVREALRVRAEADALQTSTHCRELMIKAPPLAERAIISHLSTPDFTAPIISILGFDAQHDAFSVEVTLPWDVETYDPLKAGFERPRDCFRPITPAKTSVLVRQRFDGKWEVIDPKAPLTVVASRCT